MKVLPLLSLLTCVLLSACGKAPDQPGGGATPSPTPAARADLRIGYVLHGLNDFTQVIKQGAEDAGRVQGVAVDVTGPAGFVPTEAIGMFEGMVQRGVKGLVVVPQPGDVWVAPIREATAAKIPVLTANVTSPGSASTTWFGQDEYQSGVILADEMKKALAAAGKTGGKVVVGICAPGVDVLQKRYEGFKKGMAGSGFTVTEAFDVTPENTSNYSTWENLASANSGMVAAVGLCSVDIPNLAKLRARTKGQWVVGGYDLNVETLDAIKAGSAQVAVGQHPYLQGYLPVVALTQHLKEGKPLVQGWINVGTEVVTKENVDQVYPRESDPAARSRWYADYVQKHFSDLAAVAKPMPAK